MKLNYENPEQEVRIELIPLIDVIFCILTFFILAAVTLTRQMAINVDLPSARTGTTQLRELLIVSVDPVGQTYIEQQRVTEEQLTQALLNFRQLSPSGLVVLYASRLSNYSDVIEVLDRIRETGGRVALATLPDSSGGNQPLPSPETIPNLDNPDGSLDLFELPGGLSDPNPGVPEQPIAPSPNLTPFPGTPSPGSP
ncbi:ExbD/TolR family protein [Egbenema bharatensis]|uniref:ExbD/TolR family protein n=1 Tax=Egbenema bharatensis TaxID=3463334 RepID=UPI003A855F0A